MEVSRHIPVMSEKVLFWLVRGGGLTYLDCTVGYSGHAEKLLEASG
ncbi:MAG: 16S rRNA (cytosine(1402)-N(4))-methyltransferase, partial [Nitrospirae bacterium]